MRRRDSLLSRSGRHARLAPVWEQEGGFLIMTSIGKVLMVGAVAALAIAVSAVPSEAAKRRAKAPANCLALTQCTMAKTNVVHYCGFDAKWVPMLMPACQHAGCPPPCPR
jgi:hypothetical protein